MGTLWIAIGPWCLMADNQDKLSVLRPSFCFDDSVLIFALIVLCFLCLVLVLLCSA